MIAPVAQHVQDLLLAAGTEVVQAETAAKNLGQLGVEAATLALREAFRHQDAGVERARHGVAEGLHTKLTSHTAALSEQYLAGQLGEAELQMLLKLAGRICYGVPVADMPDPILQAEVGKMLDTLARQHTELQPTLARLVTESMVVAPS